MEGKRVVVTGGSSGIGLQTALSLAGMGAELVIVGRSEERVAKAVGAIRGTAGHDRVHGEVADLSNMQEVRALAGRIQQSFARIHVLVNNAGAMYGQREVTADGYERTFATNHLAPFLLTHLLWPQLLAAGHARVVTVASEAHRGHALDFEDLMMAVRYSRWKAYGRSKLANILFTRQLAEVMKASGVTANSLHPGVVASNFFEGQGWWRWLGKVARPLLISPAEGARTSVYLACRAEVANETGKYYIKCREHAPSEQAADGQAAETLWEVSSSLVGLDRALGW